MRIVSININSGTSNFGILKVGSIELEKKLASEFILRKTQKTGMVMKKV